MRVDQTLAFAAIAIQFACSQPSAPAATISFASVSAGGSHTCGLSTEGRTYCWGSNTFAQLGGGPSTLLESHFYPAVVAGDVAFMAVSAGGLHTCALDASGTAYCWGANQYGQLGIGSDPAPERCRSTPCASTATAVSGALQFRVITAGWGHTCALSRSGDVYCWGDNRQGELGNDSIQLGTSTPTRVPRPGDADFVALGAGQWHTCAVSADGRAYCWGQNNWGQVGPAAKDTCFAQDATKLPCSRTPVLAAAGLALVTIGGGWGHTCALASDGATYCWGYDGSGQLGVEPVSVSMECPLRPESRQCSPQPLRVAGNLAFVALTVGGSHNCGLLENGEAYCWGGHLVGQLGDCSLRDYSAVPRPVCGGHRYILLSAGSGHTCAVAVAHDAYCWGPNDSGELGSGTLTAFGPVPVGPPEN